MAGAEAMPLGEVFAFLSAHRFTFLSLFLGMAGLTFAGYANSLWVIKLFAVNHGWSKAQAGVIIGLIISWPQSAQVSVLSEYTYSTLRLGPV